MIIYSALQMQTFDASQVGTFYPAPTSKDDSNRRAIGDTLTKSGLFPSLCLSPPLFPFPPPLRVPFLSHLSASLLLTFISSSSSSSFFPLLSPSSFPSLGFVALAEI